jgi:hypothetical protein
LGPLDQARIRSLASLLIGPINPGRQIFSKTTTGSRVGLLRVRPELLGFPGSSQPPQTSARPTSAPKAAPSITTPCLLVMVMTPSPVARVMIFSGEAPELISSAVAPATTFSSTPALANQLVARPLPTLLRTTS